MNNSSKENRSEWLKYRDGVGVCAGGPELDLDKLNRHLKRTCSRGHHQMELFFQTGDTVLLLSLFALRI